MKKDEFIEKNVSFIEKMANKCRKLMVFNIIPQFVKSVMTVKKIAKILGYPSVVTFLRALTENPDEADARYAALSEEKQNLLDHLYDDVFVPQTDELLENCDDYKKTVESVAIPMNVVANLDPDSVDENDDPEEENAIDEIKQFLIDKLFDGVDIVEEFPDDEDN